MKIKTYFVLSLIFMIFNSLMIAGIKFPDDWNFINSESAIPVKVIVRLNNQSSKEVSVSLGETVLDVPTSVTLPPHSFKDIANTNYSSPKFARDRIDLYFSHVKIDFFVSQSGVTSAVSMRVPPFDINQHGRANDIQWRYSQSFSGGMLSNRQVIAELLIEDK